MPLRTTLTALAVVGAVSDRSLPQCKCADVWPTLGGVEWDAEGSFGWTHPDFGWEIPAGVRGCTDKGWWTNYGMAPRSYCIPDTTNGPCIAYGNFDTDNQMGLIACNMDGTLPEVDETHTGGAYAYANSLVESEIPPLCECDEDWSKSKLAATYCSDMAGNAKGPVNETTCPNAPKDFANIGNGSIDYGYGKRGQLNVVVSWCAPKITSAAGCMAVDVGNDKCAGNELWMLYPNKAGPKDHSDLEHNTAQYVVVDAIGGLGNLFLWSGDQLSGMTFGGTYGEVAPILELKKQLIELEAKELGSLPAPKPAEVPPIDPAQKAKIEAETASNIVKCKNNMECKSKMDETSCPAVKAATQSKLGERAFGRCGSDTAQLLVSELACMSDENCSGFGYCSTNTHKCKTLKKAGEYCNIVQKCASSLSCADSVCAAQKM